MSRDISTLTIEQLRLLVAALTKEEETWRNMASEHSNFWDIWMKRCEELREASDRLHELEGTALLREVAE